MSWKRWITAVVGVPALLILCWWGVRPFAWTMAVLALLGVAELITAQRRAGLSPNVPIALLGVLGPAAPLLFPYGIREATFSLAALGGFVGAVFLAGLIYELNRTARTQKLAAGANVGAGLLCASYVSLLGGISLLRWTPSLRASLPAAGGEPGFYLVLVVLGCVWATDTAAYYVGTALGSTRLAPAISPQKTVEGAVAGFAAAVVAGALLGHFLLGRAFLGWCIGAAAGIVGQLGDLFESALKRELGVKDLGWIFPGHGGILDRFDSLMFTAPVVWLLLQLMA